jgi:hypothetical protein
VPLAVLDEDAVPPTDETAALLPHPLITAKHEANNSHSKMRTSIRPLDVILIPISAATGTLSRPEMLREAGSKVECRE